MKRNLKWDRYSDDNRFIEAVIDKILSTGIASDIDRNRTRGRRGYGTEAMLRCHILTFLQRNRRMNDTIRHLWKNAAARDLVGFDKTPHRSSYNRFRDKLARNDICIDFAIADLTEQIRAITPDLGQMVAVDATHINAYASPDSGIDADAAWGVKTTIRPKNGQNHQDWFFGYKLHLLADTQNSIPLAYRITSGNENDGNYLVPMMEHVKNHYDWFDPKVLTADRGYDAGKIFHYLQSNEVAPVIKIQDRSRGKLIDGIYDKKGVPHCAPDRPMKFVTYDPARGYYYVCAKRGCEVVDSVTGRVRKCAKRHWADPRENIRLFGVPRRASEAWDNLYLKRMDIERLFKSMKHHLCLGTHSVRGLDAMRAHVKMVILIYLAIRLVGDQNGIPPKWMVPKVD